jgi:hypothetical protein
MFDPLKLKVLIYPADIVLSNVTIDQDCLITGHVENGGWFYSEESDGYVKWYLHDPRQTKSVALLSYPLDYRKVVLTDSINDYNGLLIDNKDSPDMSHLLTQYFSQPPIERVYKDDNEIPF